jgi:hypothetical protein
MPKWAGESTLAAAFSALNEGAEEGDDGGSDKAVEKCISYSAEYKMVVFDVEKVMKALSSFSNRMKVMHVIDGICRKARGKARDQFQSRFAGRIKHICALFDGCEGSVRSDFVRVISSWKQDDIIPASSLPHIDREEIDEANSGDSSSSKSDSEVTKKDSKKEDKKKAGKGKVIKYCSFREGSCPFGEKCRFSHAAQGADYTIVKRKTKRLADISTGTQDKTLKYANLDVNKATRTREILRSDSKIPPSLISVAGDQDSSAHIEFKRQKIEAYTTRSDIQIASISLDDLKKVFPKMQ